MILDPGVAVARPELSDPLLGASARLSALRTTDALSIIITCSSLRMSAIRSPFGRDSSVGDFGAGSELRIAGSGGRSAVATYSSMCRPARRPKTTRSTSELVPSRLAPCTETQAFSPAE